MTISPHQSPQLSPQSTWKNLPGYSQKQGTEHPSTGSNEQNPLVLTPDLIHTSLWAQHSTAQHIRLLPLCRSDVQYSRGGGCEQQNPSILPTPNSLAIPSPSEISPVNIHSPYFSPRQSPPPLPPSREIPGGKEWWVGAARSGGVMEGA